MSVIFGAWRISRRNCNILGCLEYRLKHVFHEDNAVADFLTKWGVEGLNIDWSFNDNLSDQLQGLFRMDKISLPYLHIL